MVSYSFVKISCRVRIRVKTSLKVRFYSVKVAMLGLVLKQISGLSMVLFLDYRIFSNMITIKFIFNLLTIIFRLEDFC